ncbi:hypothetical protein LP414_08140 [Polaromonas sp. P1(28)-13]|nr:hypothetical protein LP414_08140 [Polaromonas sp. P1(28)-13]
MTTSRRASTTIVAGVNPTAVDRYKEMRNALMNAPGIDRTMCEVVITCQLALLGHEVPFKIHALRLRELNISKEQLQQVILAGVGGDLHPLRGRQGSRLARPGLRND